LPNPDIRPAALLTTRRFILDCGSGNELVALNLATGVEKMFQAVAKSKAMATRGGIVAAVSVIPEVISTAS
jgi:hypothetical protein